MSTPNSLFAERVAVLAVLDPQTISNTTVDSEYAPGADVGRVAFVASIGTIDAATTVDLLLLEATDSSGTGAQALTGKAATQLTATDDNKQVVLEVGADELTAGFTHVACRVTVAGSTADASVVGLGIDARNEPASAGNAASVAELVS